MANLKEQWEGDWMRDAETGQLIDGPAMNRYEMFMLIRGLRAVIHAHAQTVRDKEAVIEELRTALQDFSRQNCEVGLQAMREKHKHLQAAIGHIAAMAKSLAEPNQ